MIFVSLWLLAGLICFAGMLYVLKRGEQLADEGDSRVIRDLYDIHSSSESLGLNATSAILLASLLMWPYAIYVLVSALCSD